MKIAYLQINARFKNLDQVRITFDDEQLMTVVVGWNGAGKSNVLEALVSIFRNLDLGEAPLFAYEIQYKLGDGESEKWVKVNADPVRGDTPAKHYQIAAAQKGEKDLFDEENWQPVPLSKVVRNKDGQAPYLPRHLFAYYSGPSDRLETYFKKHRTDFYRLLLRNKLQLKGEIRPLFYAKPIHSQFVLLAFFLASDNSRDLTFLKELIGIEDLDSVHIVLRKPDWGNRSKDELFWGADGVVREFLDRVFPHALAPIKITRNEDLSLTGKNITNEFFHLFLPDRESLRDVAGNLNPDEFFKMLESTLLSEIISEVRVRVKVKNVDQALSFRELSEGEQQLLTVLGLLKFTGGKDTLFLLDEPDTHLNPAWSVKYLSFLDRFVQNDNKTCHLVMITHDPLAVAELTKEQVQIMWRDKFSQVYAEQPAEDPRGMGFEGILMSDMFGLKSPVDPTTQKLLDDKLLLLAKDELSPKENKKLVEIDAKLSSYGMNYASADPLYSLFLKKMAKHAKQISHPKEVVLTEDQRKELDQITESVIAEINAEAEKRQTNDSH